MVKPASNDRAQRVTAVANRLRMIQVELADEGPEVRADYLRDELGRTLTAISPADRRAFLEALQSEFPVWDGQAPALPVVVATPAAAPATPPPPPVIVQQGVDPKELEKPEFVLDKLLALAGNMSAEQKADFTDKLAEVGLTKVTEIAAPAPAGAGDWPEAPAKSVKAKMGMDPNAALRTHRVLETLDLLVDFATSLDTHIWSQWRAVAPNATARRGSPVQRELAKFIAEDPRNTLPQELGQLRKLIVSLMAATGQAGRFATKQFARVAPYEIEELEKSKGGGWANWEKRYWRCYCEMFSTLEGDVLENELRRAFTEYVEQLMRGGGSDRPSGGGGGGERGK